ncbi:telomerase-binding protein EST1A [Neosynchiropus ocellatus]
MADDLDRVRISAAELRAEASSSLTSSDCRKAEEHHVSKHQRKRPDLQRYQPVLGHGRHRRDSEEGDAGQKEDCIGLSSDPQKLDRKSKVKSAKGSNSNKQEYVEGAVEASTRSEDRIRGDGSNCRKETQPLTRMEKPQGNDSVDNREHLEPAASVKPTKKARKPDREFYQPGGRRNIQAPVSTVGREQDKPPSKTFDRTPEPHSRGTAVETGDKPNQKNEGKEIKAKPALSAKCVDTNQKPREMEKPLASEAALERISNKVEKLSIKDKNKAVGEGKTSVQDDVRRGDAHKAKKEQTDATQEGEGRKEKSRRRRGGEREREWKPHPKREDQIGDRGKAESGEAFRDRVRKTSESDRHSKSGKTEDTHQSKGRGNRQEARRGENNNNNWHEKDVKTQRNDEKKASTSNHTTQASKRYSKSDVRHSRNRTYSSSSASSVTSLDTSGRLESVENRVGHRRHLAGWTGNGDSSSESMEGEMSDPVEDRRKRSKARDINLKSRRAEKNTVKANRDGGRGIIKVSLEKPCGTFSQRNDAQQRKQGQTPRGRGGGILVLPARTDVVSSPEVGQRMLFGRMRGGAASRSRGGRGGGVRRLWDPNNPDQKPALARTPPAQQSPLQQSLYLQTGSAYGQLHFLDTDDEVSGSPPVAKNEHLRSQQAAAMAYYKFQNSDNPYGYPVTPSNPSTTTSQRFHVPYMSPTYQMANSVYLGPGVGQYCGNYRGAGYSQPSAAGLTPEEAEQHIRGEMGRLLRAADAQELQLSNLLSRDRVSADGLDRMAQLRAELLVLYEQVILSDIELSDSQNVDQALWKNVFYQVIERFRQLLKDPTSDNGGEIRNMLLVLLDEGALFFDSLLQKLQTVYQFKLEDYMDGMAIRARPLRKTVKYALISAQRCMICQGDLARYREQASDSANYGKARSWYLKAQQIAPKNGRPYNQLALLAVYTKRKLDAVYYYMRSLAASNPILTAKESLMSLFEEAKRKAEQLERRRRQEQEGGSEGPAVRGRGRGVEGARTEIWVRPTGQATNLSSQRGGSESSRDSEQDGELGTLSASDLNKRFILSFLHTHGKLFTKVGMESFPQVASQVLQEFRALLHLGPSLLGSMHMLQIMTVNMFTIHNALSRGEEGDVRSVLQEQSTALGLGMFALMVQRCTELLRDTPAEPVSSADKEEREDLDGMVRVSDFPLDLRELLPSIKVWSDWMLGHPEQWNPPPCGLEGSPDVWQCLADLCNALARVDHEELPLYKGDTEEGEGDDELTVLQLKEDKLLAGFVPLLAAPQEPCYIDKHTDKAIAADCKRVTVLKYFLEALCGQEEPLLAFKGGKYVSVAEALDHAAETRTRGGSATEKEGDDVIVEAESSFSASEGDDDDDDDVEEAGDSESDIRQLKARRHALANKLALQQKRRDQIQAVLHAGGQLQLEVRPLYLVPDTNGFIDHLEGLKKLLQCGTYIVVVPLIVITELDGLAKGQESFGGGQGSGRGPGGRSYSDISAAHARAVQDKSRLAVAFLERSFEDREPCLRALTSRGNQLESIAFRSEDTSGQQGNNDDVILSCCLHYCKDKTRDASAHPRNETVKLQREVVLLTDDRNLRVKALTRNVPVRDIPAFLSWAKVG